MRRPSLSIGLRLALWFTLLLAIALLAFSWVVYSLQKSSLQRAAEENLEESWALLSTLITVDASGQPRLNIDHDADELNDTFIRLLDRNGGLISDTSETYGDVPLTPAVVARAIREDNDIFSSVPGEDEGTFLLTEPIVDGGNVVGSLQVGQSRQDYVEAMSSLVGTLLKTVPVALLVTALIGWWISSRALKPVNQVTAMARDISGGDLSRRLRLDLPDDEIGRLATTFDEMIERLESMVRRQRQFTADASHELRTPLTAMRGQVDVALSQPRDAESYRGTLAGINNQVLRMTRLVESLLILARSESGTLKLDLEQVDISQLMETARDITAPSATEKGLALRVAPGPTAAVRGDESLLLQMLLNLIDNAIRYTERGEVAIGWEIAGANVELIVQDTGPGIPEEQLERIFEPFYRIDPARAYTRGAGLGLSICRTIARAHGGEIKATTSELGATFVAELPLATEGVAIAPGSRAIAASTLGS